MQYFGFDRPSFGIKTYGFGANPDDEILALFAGDKQGVWYDPSDKSTLFQDVAGTIPVTKDGDPVALMRDKSGNGNHAVQSVSTSRPIYKTDGILHWLEFDGIDDGMYSPVITWSATLEVSATVIHKNSSVRGTILSAYLDTSTAIMLWYLELPSGDTSNQLRALSRRGAGAKIATSDVLLGDKTTASFQANASSLSLRVGGAVVSSTTDATGETAYQAPLAIGYRQAGADRHFSGSFFGAIVRIPTTLDSDMVTRERYLAAKSGVTL